MNYTIHMLRNYSELWRTKNGDLLLLISMCLQYPLLSRGKTVAFREINKSIINQNRYFSLECSYFVFSVLVAILR